MEQKTEREWKSIICPRGKNKTPVMIEWNIISEKGRIFKRTLRQIDCHNPPLTILGGSGCEWGCEGVIEKRER